jgi:dihydroxyacetone kinase
MDQMLEGFTKLYPQYVRPVPGGVIRSSATPAGKVSVVVGGGSGHYPAFCGVVGPGFADGAVVGNIFTSPSTEDAYNVGVASENGGGVLFLTGNYAGDVMNFNLAQARMIAQGYKVNNFYVTDDVASASIDEITKRRGIAGDFTVFKIASAAAEEGLDLDAVTELAIRTNTHTRTLGVAFAGCTLPGSEKPLFTVPEGKMGLGLGIHGESGISEDALPTAEELGKILVDGTLLELSASPIKKIAVILNGLGATKYEELFVTWRTVAALLEARGYQIVQPEVGEIVTSLDMAGCSLTVTLLDDDLERLWCAPVDTPAYKKGAPRAVSMADAKEKVSRPEIHTTIDADASDQSRDIAQQSLRFFNHVYEVIVSKEELLGNIDAVAGDGDHGRGMVKGIHAALDSAKDTASKGGGISSLLQLAGQQFAAKAGGTSGVLWGSAIEHAGQSLRDASTQFSAEDFHRAVTSGIDAISTLGKAQLGDKTMLDAMIPFAEALSRALSDGLNLKDAWSAACAIADTAANETAALRPKIGRARPLAEKSVGTPDAGAISFVMIVLAIRDCF